jgi:uncharacterized membrane protein
LDLDLFVRWLHILGACVLFGTGSGIAFFMVMAHRTRNPLVIAQRAASWFTAVRKLAEMAAAMEDGG